MINFGIIGMGIRGNLFARFISQNPYAELAAFSELDNDKRRDANKRWKVKSYKNYEDMLRNEKLQAVIVATPDFAHKEPVIKALHHELNVLVEKPFAINTEDAEEMLYEAKRAGTKCMVAFENRWNPVIVSAKNEIDRGSLGKIVTVNGLLSNTVHVPLKRFNWSSKTTCGWYLLCHLLDLTYYLTGRRAVSVYAFGTKELLKRAGIDTYDYIHTIVKYDDSGDGVYETLWILPESSPNVYDFKYYIYGEKGFIKINPEYQMIDMATDVFVYPRSLTVDYGHKMIGFPGYMLDDFIDCVRLDQPVPSSFEDGLSNTKLLEAIHNSLRTGTEEKV